MVGLYDEILPHRRIFGSTRQLGVEEEMRAMRLVYDRNFFPLPAYRDELIDIGCRAVVCGIQQDNGDGVWMRCKGCAQLPGADAVCYARFGVKLGDKPDWRQTCQDRGAYK